MPDLQPQGPGRIVAIAAIGYQGEAALDILVELVEQGDPPIRAAALASLARIPSPTSTRRFECSLGDRAPEVRDALIRAIAKLPADDRKRLLAQMVPLGDGSEIPAILDVYPGQYDELVRLVRQTGAAAIDPLIAVLRQGSPTRVAAAGYLGFMRDDDGAVDALLANLSARNWILRQTIAAALGQLGATRAIEPLERLLLDRNKYVRAAARRALADLYQAGQRPE